MSTSSNETVKIEHTDWADEPVTSYIFADVAELFWPGDYSHSNHDAEERVRDRMIEKGCVAVRNGLTTPGSGIQYTGYKTPASDTLVGFDSESGAFEAHAANDAPLLYVKTIIDEIKDELDAHREALR